MKLLPIPLYNLADPTNFLALKQYVLYHFEPTKTQKFDKQEKSHWLPGLTRTKIQEDTYQYGIGIFQCSEEEYITVKRLLTGTVGIGEKQITAAQLSVIYFFNLLHQSKARWTTKSAEVHTTDIFSIEPIVIETMTVEEAESTLDIKKKTTYSQKRATPRNFDKIPLDSFLFSHPEDTITYRVENRTIVTKFTPLDSSAQRVQSEDLTVLGKRHRDASEDTEPNAKREQVENLTSPNSPSTSTQAISENQNSREEAEAIVAVPATHSETQQISTKEINSTLHVTLLSEKLNQLHRIIELDVPEVLDLRGCIRPSKIASVELFYRNEKPHYEARTLLNPISKARTSATNLNRIKMLSCSLNQNSAYKTLNLYIIEITDSLELVHTIHLLAHLAYNNKPDQFRTLIREALSQMLYKGNIKALERTLLSNQTLYETIECAKYYWKAVNDIQSLPANSKALQKERITCASDLDDLQQMHDEIFHSKNTILLGREVDCRNKIRTFTNTLSLSTDPGGFNFMQACFEYIHSWQAKLLTIPQNNIEKIHLNDFFSSTSSNTITRAINSLTINLHKMITVQTEESPSSKEENIYESVKRQVNSITYNIQQNSKTNLCKAIPIFNINRGKDFPQLNLIPMEDIDEQLIITQCALIASDYQSNGKLIGSLSSILADKPYQEHIIALSNNFNMLVNIGNSIKLMAYFSIALNDLFDLTTNSKPIRRISHLLFLNSQALHKLYMPNSFFTQFQAQKATSQLDGLKGKHIEKFIQQWKVALLKSTYSTTLKPQKPTTITPKIFPITPNASLKPATPSLFHNPAFGHYILDTSNQSTVTSLPAWPRQKQQVQTNNSNPQRMRLQKESAISLQPHHFTGHRIIATPFINQFNDHLRTKINKQIQGEECITVNSRQFMHYLQLLVQQSTDNTNNSTINNQD